VSKDVKRCGSARRQGQTRGYYLHELSKQWRGGAPPIDEGDWALIKDGLDSLGLPPREITNTHVVRVLDSIGNDPAHKTRKTRWQNTGQFKKRRFRSVYGERLMDIRGLYDPRADGYCAGPPPPSRALREACFSTLQMAQRNFEIHRHARGCPGRPPASSTCHKTRGCRKKLPCKQIIRRALRRIIETNPALATEADSHLSSFPPLVAGGRSAIAVGKLIDLLIPGDVGGGGGGCFRRRGRGRLQIPRCVILTSVCACWDGWCGRV
jgi:hypothetical protein